MAIAPSEFRVERKITPEAIAEGHINPEWVPEEYFTPFTDPLTEAAPPDLTTHRFTVQTAAFYQPTFDKLYPDIETNETPRRIYDALAADRDPGAILIFDRMRDSQQKSPSVVGNAVPSGIAGNKT